MAQAEPQSRSGRRREHQPRGAAAKILVLLVAAAAMIAVPGCGLGAETTPEEVVAPIAAAADPETSPPPSPREVEVVVDPSQSVPRHYLRASLRALATAVREIPEPLPKDGASAWRQEVSITVRPVSADAYSPAARLVTGTIRAVPEISSLPEETDADLTAAAVEVGEQREAAEQALEGAVRDAEDLAAEIAALDPPVTGCSDVIGGISASAESFTGDDRRLVVISDLSQACDPNVGGSLEGTKILVVHICEEAARCYAQRAAWRERLGARGADPPRFVRVENLTSSLIDFVAGG
jgi:hypothetical protein